MSIEVVLQAPTIVRCAWTRFALGDLTITKHWVTQNEQLKRMRMKIYCLWQLHRKCNLLRARNSSKKGQASCKRSGIVHQIINLFCHSYLFCMTICFNYPTSRVRIRWFSTIRLVQWLNIYRIWALHSISRL